jgi:hypothetical protein
METNVPYHAIGRPELDPEQRRSELLKSYVTPDEYTLIKMKCQMAGMSVSDFLRSLAIDQEIDTTANPDELKKIRAELGKIGSNINQIAKAVNSGQSFDEARLKEMAAWLVKTIERL